MADATSTTSRHSTTTSAHDAPPPTMVVVVQPNTTATAPHHSGDPAMRRDSSASTGLRALNDVVVDSSNATAAPAAPAAVVVVPVTCGNVWWGNTVSRTLTVFGVNCLVLALVFLALLVYTSPSVNPHHADGDSGDATSFYAMMTGIFAAAALVFLLPLVMVRVCASTPAPDGTLVPQWLQPTTCSDCGGCSEEERRRGDCMTPAESCVLGTCCFWPLCYNVPYGCGEWACQRLCCSQQAPVLPVSDRAPTPLEAVSAQPRRRRLTVWHVLTLVVLTGYGITAWLLARFFIHVNSGEW